LHKPFLLRKSLKQFAQKKIASPVQVIADGVLLVPKWQTRVTAFW
jgi:hypothetical protein